MFKVAFRISFNDLLVYYAKY